MTELTSHDTTCFTHRPCFLLSGARLFYFGRDKKKVRAPQRTVLRDEEAVRARRARTVRLELFELIDDVLVFGKFVVCSEVRARDDPAGVRALRKGREGRFIAFAHRLHEQLLLHLRSLADRPVQLNGQRRLPKRRV